MLRARADIASIYQLLFYKLEYIMQGILVQEWQDVRERAMART